MAKEKILFNEEGKKFFVKDASQDYHSQYGFFSSGDMDKKSRVTSNKGKVFSVFDPTFLDRFQKIKRDAQIITLKDAGLIISETGMGPETLVVDAGAGSGALACLMAHMCKKVVTYEIRVDFRKIVEQNKKFLGLKNLTIRNGDVYEKILERDVDVVTFDLPEPWKALDNAATAMKTGGFLVSYMPTVPQMADFVNSIHAHDAFVHIKSLELVQREWEVLERKVRPKTTQTVHTGFLSFARKIG